jgi:hypothetical protein
MDYIVSAAGFAMATYMLLEARAIWVTRRQPVRSTSPTNEVWITPEPRSRRHYES